MLLKLATHLWGDHQLHPLRGSLKEKKRTRNFWFYAVLESFLIVSWCFLHMCIHLYSFVFFSIHVSFQAKDFWWSSCSGWLIGDKRDRGGYEELVQKASLQLDYENHLASWTCLLIEIWANGLWCIDNHWRRRGGGPDCQAHRLKAALQPSSICTLPRPLDSLRVVRRLGRLGLKWEGNAMTQGPHIIAHVW